MWDGHWASLDVTKRDITIITKGVAQGRVILFFIVLVDTGMSMLMVILVRRPAGCAAAPATKLTSTNRQEVAGSGVMVAHGKVTGL